MYNHKFKSAIWLDLTGNQGNMEKTVVANENTERVTEDGLPSPGQKEWFVN